MFKLLLLGLATTVQSMVQSKQKTLQPPPAPNTCSAPRYYSVEVQVASIQPPSDPKSHYSYAQFSNGGISGEKTGEKTKIELLQLSKTNAQRKAAAMTTTPGKYPVFNALGKFRLCQQPRAITLTLDVAIIQRYGAHFQVLSEQTFKIDAKGDDIYGATISVYARESAFHRGFSTRGEGIPKMKAIDAADIATKVSPGNYAVTVTVSNYEAIDAALTTLTEKQAQLTVDLQECRAGS
jgi:hypothetical protein